MASTDESKAPRLFKTVSLIVLLVFAALYLRITFGVLRMLWFSTLVPARVVKMEASPDRRAAHDVRVSYTFGETAYTAQLQIASAAAADLKEGEEGWCTTANTA